MKTVWHWKEIGKSFCVAILVAIIYSCIPLPDEVSFLVGLVVGFISMVLCMAKWEMWHFE